MGQKPLLVFGRGQLRTFNQLYAYQGPSIQPRQVSKRVLHARIPVQQAPAQVSKGLEVATTNFQQMLLKDNIPWISEQLQTQSANSGEPQIAEQVSNETMRQRLQNHIPRRPDGLNPEAIEFQTPQINEQASASGTSQASQSEVSASNSIMSYTTERIKKLEGEVAALKMALKKHIEHCTCKKDEGKLEGVIREIKMEEMYSGPHMPMRYMSPINGHTDFGAAGRDLRKLEFSKERTDFASSVDLIQL